MELNSNLEGKLGVPVPLNSDQNLSFCVFEERLVLYLLSDEFG